MLLSSDAYRLFGLLATALIASKTGLLATLAVVDVSIVKVWTKVNGKLRMSASLSLSFCSLMKFCLMPLVNLRNSYTRATPVRRIVLFAIISGVLVYCGVSRYR